MSLIEVLICFKADLTKCIVGTVLTARNGKRTALALINHGQYKIWLAFSAIMHS